MATNYIDVMPASELVENTTVIVEAGGKRVMLANDEGVIRAVSPYCTHDGGDLDCEGVENHEVCCHRHDATFDLRSGEATRLPAVFGLTTYEIRIEDGRIYIAI